MGAEEQEEERGVLDSIFPEEITDISKTEFRISTQLEVTNAKDDDSEAPTIILNVRYTPNYPDEAPDLDITQPPNAARHPYLDIQEDKPTLLSSLSETITDNLGMQMIFTLVTVLKDSAELLISERQTAKAALEEVEAQKAEEEENRKFQGEAVTRESFLKWREGFRRELAEEEQRKKEEAEAEEKKRRERKEEKKLTGKEMWQQGLVGKVDEEEGDDGLEDMEKLKLREVAS